MMFNAAPRASVPPYPSVRCIESPPKSPGVIGEGKEPPRDPHDASLSLSRSGGSFALFGNDSFYSDASESNLSACSLFSASGHWSPSFGRGSPNMSHSQGLTDENASSMDLGSIAKARGASLDLMVPLLRVTSADRTLCSEASTPQDKGPTDAPRSRCGRPDGKFPLCAEGRCGHKEHWSRLRGKRGHAYFFCKYCGLGWRVARPKTPDDAAGDWMEDSTVGNERADEDASTALGCH